MSQRTLARSLGLSEAAVSTLKKRGMPVDEGVEACQAWRNRNVAPYARTASASVPAPSADTGGSAPSPAGGTLDLGQERARLAREQRIGIEIKNAVLRGEYAPISLLAEVLASASQAVAERFDHLPGQIKRVAPTLPPAVMDRVMTTIAEARNEWVRQTSSLAIDGLVGVDDAAELEGLDDPGAAG